MKKKIFITVILVCIVACVVFSINSFTKKQVQEGNKEIHITVVDVDNNNTVLYEGLFKTKAELLGEFLNEAKELQVVSEQGEYGSYIVSMVGKETNQISGPWIVYNSDNNSSCQANGYCDAIDILPIEDGNNFIFEFRTKFDY